jgi:hypothetical protein
LWHKAGFRGRLVEVKTSPNAFSHFGPEDRQALKERAESQSLDPVLAHTPSPTKPIAWLPESSWPKVRRPVKK